MILEGLGDEALERRFWAKVSDSTRHWFKCWEWTGARDPSGYGRFGIGTSGSALAHRVSFWLATGVEPGEAVVMHTCDNPPCVNPWHLRLGTHAENCADKMAKGRYVRPREKFNDETILAVRRALARGVRYEDIAKQYDIAMATISKIKHGRRVTTAERARSFA